MQTKDVIKATGLSKQTILYYEKEGLITPTREDNEYRNYSETDVQNLLVIKFLRSININIEDIKAIIQKQLSFQECLQNQTLYIENTIQELQHIKKSIQNYKEKQLPLIPSLQEIDNIPDSSLWGLGYQKTTPLITLGRRPTKNLIKRIFLGQCVLSLIIVWIMSYTKINSLFIFIISLSLLFLLQILILAKGLGNINLMGMMSGTTIYQSNPFYYLEFLEEGVRYYKLEKVTKQLHYLFDLLRNKEVSSYLMYYSYEDINKVTIQRKTRYIGMRSIIAINTNTYDFTFFFNDQTNYFLYNPITLDNDLLYTINIITNKIKVIENINDALETISKKNMS